MSATLESWKTITTSLILVNFFSFIFTFLFHTWLSYCFYSRCPLFFSSWFCFQIIIISSDALLLHLYHFNWIFSVSSTTDCSFLIHSLMLYFFLCPFLFCLLFFSRKLLSILKYWRVSLDGYSWAITFTFWLD